MEGKAAVTEEIKEISNYTKKITMKNLRRETFLLEQIKGPTSGKLEAIIKNADEEVSEWLFREAIKSWKKLNEKIEEKEKKDDKEDKILEILQLYKKSEENIAEYAERLAKRAKELELKERIIISLLSVLIAKNEKMKLEINNARDIQDALFRINALREQFMANRKKNEVYSYQGSQL